jgi:hypothetical protein
VPDRCYGGLGVRLDVFTAQAVCLAVGLCCASYLLSQCHHSIGCGNAVMIADVCHGATNVAVFCVGVRKSCLQLDSSFIHVTPLAVAAVTVDSAGLHGRTISYQPVAASSHQFVPVAGVHYMGVRLARRPIH